MGNILVRKDELKYGIHQLGKLYVKYGPQKANSEQIFVEGSRFYGKSRNENLGPLFILFEMQ